MQTTEGSKEPRAVDPNVIKPASLMPMRVASPLSTQPITRLRGANAVVHADSEERETKADKRRTYSTRHGLNYMPAPCLLLTKPTVIHLVMRDLT